MGMTEAEDVSESKSEEPEGRSRVLRGRAESAVAWFLITGTLIHILNVLGFWSWIGSEISWLRWLIISPMSFRGVHLFFAVPAIFFLTRASKRSPGNRLPWYDAILIVLCFVGFGYRFIFWEAYETRFLSGGLTTFELVSGIVLLLVIWEASRRTFGLWMPIIALVFFIYPFIGPYLPGFLAARALGLPDAVRGVVLGYEGIYGGLVGLAANILVMFMFMGRLLAVSGAGQFFIDLALVLVGRVRGGPALAAVTASALFGSINAASSANVVVTGTITIPLMKSIGFKPTFAGGVESAASNGGVLLPPVMGTVAFVMAEILGITYWQVCIYSFLPAVLYYIGIAANVVFESRKLGLSALPPDKIPSLKKTLMSGWQFLLPIVILVYFLAVLGYSAQRSCLYATVALVVVSMFRRETRLTWPRLKASLEGVLPTVAAITCLLALAGIMIGSINATGLGPKLSSGLIAMSGGNIPLLLLLTALACLLLGMPLPITGAYVLLAALIAPALGLLGVPLFTIHMFILYFAVLGPITPPSCSCAFVAATIAGAGTSPFRTGWTALRLVTVALIVPFTFTYNPVLLMQGGAGEIAVGFLTAVAGVTALAIGTEGWLLDRINWGERILFVGAGLMLIWPSWQTDVTGVVTGAIVTANHLAAVQRQKRRLTMSA